MENIKKSGYMAIFTSMIDMAKEELDDYVELVDTVIHSNSKRSGIANTEYLSSINELARIYKDLDLSKIPGQILNFLTIAETVKSIQSGLMYESFIKADLDSGTQMNNMMYDNVLKESTDPSNYPHHPDDYDKKLVAILNKQDNLKKQYKIKFEGCKKMIFPSELLERKSSQPYIDKNGNQYQSILEFVTMHKNIVSKIDTPTVVEIPEDNFDLSDNQVDNENIIHM